MEKQGPSVRWEKRSRTSAWLLALSLLATVPYGFYLAGQSRLQRLGPAWLRLFDDRLYREVTGFIGLGLVLLALSFSLCKRTRLPLPYSRESSRGVHLVVGTASLQVLLLHTGGRAGTNLDFWLLASLVGAIFTAILGVLVENRRIRRLAVWRPGKAPRWSVGDIRGLWFPVHILMVAASVVLLLFHILQVYYF